MPDETSTLVVQFRDAGAAAGLQGLQGELGRTAAATEGASAALPSFYAGAEQAGIKAAGAERGMRRLEYGLTAVATQSLGAESGLLGAAARASEAGLLFGYGSEGVLTIAAGFGAFGITLKAIEAPLHAVMKDTAGLSTEYEKLTASLHPGVSAMEQVLTVAQQLAQVQEDAQPNFWEELFGTGIFGALGGAPLIQELTDAQNTYAESAKATGESLKPVLEELVAIGHTKDLIRNVTAEMANLDDVGTRIVRHIGTHPAAGILGLDPAKDVPAHTEVSGTGLVGAQQAAVAKARGMGWATSIADGAVEQIDRDFVSRVGKAFDHAAQNLVDPGGLSKMRDAVVDALKASGLSDAVINQFVETVNTDYVRAIDTLSKAGALDPLQRQLRAPALGVTNRLSDLFHAPSGDVFPTTHEGAFDLQTFNLADFRQNLTRGIGRPGELGPGQLQEANRLAAQDDPFAKYQTGLKALQDVFGPNGILPDQEKFTRGLETLQKQYDLATKKSDQLGITLVGAIGAAIGAFSSGTPAGLLGGAGGLLTTLSSQAGLGLAGLGLPGAILGVLAGLAGTLGGNGPQRVTVSAYETTALQQMKALTDQLGTLVSVIVTNAEGQPLDNVAYGLNRLTRRDGVPRFPRGVGGT